LRLYSNDKTQSIDFDIADDIKKIAVNVSGGADSAILLYMVADYLVKNNRTESTELNVLTCVNDFKGRWNARKAAAVIDFVIGRTGCPINMHYSYYRPTQDVKYFHEIERKLISRGDIDLMVAGLTLNPIGRNIVTNIHGKNIDLAEKALPERNVNHMKLLNGNYWFPFANTDKKMVSSLYDQYKVNELFPLTRSCETIPEMKDGIAVNSNFENEPCGECWWCLERKWAFGEF
jgi:hypothetical protein